MSKSIFNCCHFKRLGLLVISTPLLLLLAGCASLTKSQLTEVNQFGQITANFSTYPAAIYPSFLEIHKRALLYSANATTDPADHYGSILSAYQLKKGMAPLDEKLKTAFMIIDKYGQALVMLTSDKHSAALDTAAKSLGSNLDGLVTKYNSLKGASPLPSGIGGAVAELITLGGEQFIRCKQANEVKGFVTKADPMVTALMNDFSAYLNGNFKKPDGSEIPFKDLIANERKEVQQDYIFYLGLNEDKLDVHPVNSTSIPAVEGKIIRKRFATLANDEDCYQLLEDLDHLDTLCNQALATIDKLKAAHSKLLADLVAKKKLGQILTEIQEYGNGVKGMYSTLKAIKY